MEVDPVGLLEPTGEDTGFVARRGALCTGFELKNLAGCDRTTTERRLDKRPRLINHDRVIL